MTTRQTGYFAAQAASLARRCRMFASRQRQR
jgi:hypothetical protein